MTADTRAPGLRRMIAAGVRSVRSYPGLAVSLYAVQVAMSGAAAWVSARVLASAFATSPLFDDAVGGDALALAASLTAEPAVVTTLIWIGVAAVASYVVISWFTTGGIIATFVDEPSGRADVARCFGAGGARTFFAYARLWLWSLIPYAITGVVAIVGLGFGLGGTGEALAAAPVLGRVVAGVLPAAVLLWVTSTAVDYARIELGRSETLSSWRALLRGYRIAVTSVAPLAHVLAYAGVFAAVSAIYVVATFDRPFAGAAGALLLLGLRQLVAMLRFAAKLALLGGQVERARAHPEQAGAAASPDA